jgi:hypothetical protein
MLPAYTDNNAGKLVSTLLFGTIYRNLDRFGCLVDVANHSPLQSVAVGHSGANHFNGLTSWVKCRYDHTDFCGADI